MTVRCVYPGCNYTYQVRRSQADDQKRALHQIPPEQVPKVCLMLGITPVLGKRIHLCSAHLNPARHIPTRTKINPAAPWAPSDQQTTLTRKCHLT